MIRVIKPSEISGTLRAPASKSMTQRAIAAGLLSDPGTLIRNASLCEDARAALGVAAGLGAMVSVSNQEISFEGRKEITTFTLNCGESGLAVRMFSPIASLWGENLLLTGEGSLMKRPVKMIEEALLQLGVNAESREGYLPLRISGKLRRGEARIDGSLSSQLLTGLLMALPKAEMTSVLKVDNLVSRPYIDMTLELLADFGIQIENRDYREFIIPGNQSYRTHDYSIEGDWSGASFFLVAGAIRGGVWVSGLNKESAQADRKILEALTLAGACLDFDNDRVITRSGGLSPFRFDATDCPDLFPPLAVLAAYCGGTSTLKGAGRLLHKESNRSVMIMKTLKELGISSDVEGDYLHIRGGKVTGGRIHPGGDHRIAMMAAVAAIGAAGRVIIESPECVNKSYPGFFEDLGSIGVQTEEITE